MKALTGIINLILALLLLSACSSEPAKTTGTSPSIKERIATEAKPRQSALVINPDNPTILTPLNANVVGIGASGITYQWEKNEQIISDEASSTLSNEKFVKGDRIVVSAATSDGRTFRSNPITILNAAPEIVSVKMEPERPTKKDLVKITAEAKDPDRDPVTIKYKWRKNNAIIQDASGPTIDLNNYTKKDNITFEAIPYDGEAEGKARIGKIEIINSSPIITSNPPALTNEVYTYQVVANDPDGDKIAYTLVKGPAGMELNPNTGLLKWAFTEKDSGPHSIEIKAADKDGGASIQSFDLTIVFK